MASKEQNLTHEEIWDDSALVDSWNDALLEYKVRQQSGPEISCLDTFNANRNIRNTTVFIPRGETLMMFSTRAGLYLKLLVCLTLFVLEHKLICASLQKQRKFRRQARGITCSFKCQGGGIRGREGNILLCASARRSGKLG